MSDERKPGIDLKASARALVLSGALWVLMYGCTRFLYRLNG